MRPSKSFKSIVEDRQNSAQGSQPQGQRLSKATNVVARWYERQVSEKPVGSGTSYVPPSPRLVAGFPVESISFRTSIDVELVPIEAIMTLDPGSKATLIDPVAGKGIDEFLDGQRHRPLAVQPPTPLAISVLRQSLQLSGYPPAARQMT